MRENTENLAPHQAGILSTGDIIEILATQAPAALLVLAARPIQKPVVQYGPFVMNTRDEIEHAIQDYQNGQLV